MTSGTDSDPGRRDHRADEPFDVYSLRTAVLRPAGGWAAVDVVASTGSTNADLLAEAGRGAPDRSVLIAEEQVRGRGRLDRTWTSRPGAALTMSVLWRPEGVPADRLGWVPMLAGVALVDAIRELSPELPVALKWPNDLLAGPSLGKAAGILAEMTALSGGGPGIVLGIGLNVSTPSPELPWGATSLSAHGLTASRAEVAVALLTHLHRWEADWRESGGDADASGLRSAYRSRCASLGARVRVEKPGGESLVGMAEDVDPQGRLLVHSDGGQRVAVAAGDIVHLRAADHS
ncbi:biotin--[acetyl-CoA-carboxylase] ligase [Pseudonocardia sp. HH130630-07]|uniref:biotin--[acetyl-CoA-carboxylase] ligase n=1 Tax=Pseudonocardia sp. HH130630-07 TaxID=1690815 RepID=UPI000814CF74|nr:biotin--[acetyl-CoA-carboxylase] ligase [Pseudonocardia sp. HH130630-07]ANY07546.1 biotin--acetyl-CoA-carboxylase ligase [Pseudonocardia sp. HH130630-07]